MHIVRLPFALKTLQPRIQALMEEVATYQLGEPFELEFSDSSHIEIQHDDAVITLSFERGEGVDYCVLFASEVTSLDDAYAQVRTQPQLIWVGVNPKETFFDLWHHEGLVRINASEQGSGDKERFQAMLLVALASDFPVEDALTLARAYSNNPQLSWPTERKDFPIPLTPNHPCAALFAAPYTYQPITAFLPVDRQRLRLYPVVDSADWVETVLKNDVGTTQLRIKDPDVSDFVPQLKQVTACGELHQAQVFINDYWQLAIEHGAYGVHLGQEDLEVADLNAISQAGLRLGLSTHGYYEILRAAEYQPSYIALGHIYPTTTKQMPSKPQGLHRLAMYQRLIGNDFPTVAIGGIDKARASEVWQIGVDSVAVVRAVTESIDPASAIKELYQQLPVREPSHAL